MSSRTTLSIAVVLALLALGALLGSCASTSETAANFALDAGFSKATRLGAGFEHRVYENKLARTAPDATLHIYLGGDGSPWVDGRYPAQDPTPRNPLTLRLMAEDSAPSIFVARPCYFGVAGTATRCEPSLWTSGRYGPQVVISMVAVIVQYLQEYKPESILLVGYSGGGTLATLVAPQLPGRVHLVTIAANLDIELWAELHGYLPLSASLNPVDFRDKATGIPQLHLAGLRDVQVPVAVIRSYTDGLPEGSLREYPEADHTCCWEALWSDLLLEQPWRSRR